MQSDAGPHLMLRARLMIAHRIADLAVNKLRVRGAYRVADAISKRILPQSYGKIVCPTVYGFDLALAKPGSRSVYRYGFYEPGTLDVIRRALREGDVFVDAGASVGMMSLYAAQQVGPSGTVLSFEPLKHRYDLLVESIRLNLMSNVRPFNFGLGADERTTTIFTNGISPSMVQTAGSVEKHKSHVERLGDVLMREGIDRVRMVKIDVEGFELEVLQGCEDIIRSKDPPILCVEYGVYESSGKGLVSFLRSLDSYEFFRLARGNSYRSSLVRADLDSKFRTGDNIFCMPKGTDISHD